MFVSFYIQPDISQTEKQEKFIKGIKFLKGKSDISLGNRYQTNSLYIIKLHLN